MYLGACWLGAGALFAIVVGQFAVYLILAGLRHQIKIPPISDDHTIQGPWDELTTHLNPAGNWIGYFERLIFFVVMIKGGDPWAAIGVWLVFKVAAKWEAWHHMGFVPDEIENVLPLKLALARRRWAAQGYATFLVGTVSNLILAFGGVVIATRGNQILSYMHALDWSLHANAVTDVTNQQFQVQLAVQVAAVAATLILAALAIWGDAIRSRWVGPRLTLRLFDPEGEKIKLSDGSLARYYHVQVTNERRSARATNVRVVLTKVSRPSAAGVIVPTSLSGSVQLTWQHGHSLPQYATLGPALNADLGYVLKDGDFRLSPIFFPNNLDINVRPGGRMRIEVLAISDETESNQLGIDIAWDGVWSEDDAVMRTHLVAKEVT